MAKKALTQREQRYSEGHWNLIYDWSYGSQSPLELGKQDCPVCGKSFNYGFQVISHVIEAAFPWAIGMVIEPVGKEGEKA